jgi:hypothetical protein
VAVPVPELVEDQAVTLVVRWGAQPDIRPIAQAGPGELSAEAGAAYVARYATAMIRLVVAVGPDPVRHRRGAWPWTCRPDAAATAMAVVARA